MATLLAFGSYVPERAVDNETLAALAGCEAPWIWEVSGIESRRFAADSEGVAEMGVAAARDCLNRAGLTPAQVGLLIVASGSAPRRFPGPAVSVARALGIPGVPALDLPMASAGALFGLHVAAQLAAVHGYVLVVASEKMSSVVLQEPIEKNVAILFGDGAGACVVASGGGIAEVLAASLHSDGSFSEDLRLELTGPLRMAGHTVILQASRKVPAAIAEVLAATGLAASAVEVFLLHQANRNLITRVAGAVGAPVERFYSNISRFGNTSSASMLIAASEWFAANPLAKGAPAVFAAFGAGFHWGAIAVRGA